MKKLKNLDYLLSLGLFILQIAGYSLALNELIISNLLKCVILLIIAIMSFLLSILFKKALNVDISSKVAYGLGFIGLITTSFIAGGFKVFGSWFSLMGDGVAIFLASICILIGILAILTAVLYKNYNFIHLAIAAVIGMIVCLLIHFKVDYYYLILLVSITLFVLNLFKGKKILFEFSSVAIMITSCLSVFAYNKGIVLVSILFLVNIVSLIRVLLVKKNLEYELLAIISFIGVTLVFISITTDVMAESLAVIVSVGIVLILELVLSTLRAIDSKFVKVFYKIASLVLLMIIVLGSEFNSLSHLIAIGFILVVSLVDTFAIHNDDYEKYFLPFKIIFVTYYFIKLLNVDAYIPIAFGIQAILFAIVYRVLNKNNTRLVYAIIIGISLLFAASYMESSMITNIIAIISLGISYLIFRGRDGDKISNILYLALLAIMLGMESSTSFLEVLVLLLVLGVLTFINRKSKLCFAFSMVLISIVVDDFLNLCIKNYDIYTIVSYVMFFILLGIASEILFDSNGKAKNIFAGIGFVLSFIALTDEANTFATCLFALISSLVVILVSLKNDDYKSLYYIGFVFTVIFLLELLSLFDNIPTSVYLLIISLAIIIVVSVMIIRFNKNKDKIIEEEKKKVETPKIKESINYCPECGNKVNSGDIYCAECGERLR